MTTAVKERPILMHARSINGILADWKTQTRRIINPQPPAGYTPATIHRDGTPWPIEWLWADEEGDPADYPLVDLYGKPGDRLWVREAWAAPKKFDGVPPRDIPEGERILYLADEATVPDGAVVAGRNRASIHMPRWACRLEVEVVRRWIERVQNIHSENIRAEGVENADYGLGRDGHTCSQQELRRRWSVLWDDTNRKGAWERNDWVWAVQFKRIE